MGQQWRGTAPGPEAIARGFTAIVLALVVVAVGLVLSRVQASTIVLGAGAPGTAEVEVGGAGSVGALPAPLVVDPGASAPPAAMPAVAPAAPSVVAPPGPDVVADFIPDPSEIDSEIKQQAARFVQQLMTYQPGATPASVASTVGATHGLDVTELDGMLQELVHTDAQSTGVVVYPQLGGLRSTTASVMVVASQTVIKADGSTLEESRTLDVRLGKDDGGWHVTHLASDGGPRVGRPADLGPLAAAVVDDPRIAMADSARWDIYRGEASADLLQRMLDMADRHTYSVNVLKTGHPYEVFGTDRVSAHSVGRAVDVYRVDERLVVASRDEGSPAFDLTRWLFDIGTPNLGSPWDLDPVGGRSFSDDLHQDHLHVSVR